MKRFKPITIYTFDPYADNVNRDILEAELRKLSKRANQRLVRLERAISHLTGTSYSEYGAYQVYAVPALNGKKRFKESGYSHIMYKELQQKIVQLQTFLGAKTSLVSGQRAAEQKREDTFTSGKWGTARLLDDGSENRKIKSAGNKDFYDFINSKLFSDLKSLRFTSEDLIEAYDEMSESMSNKEIHDRFEKAYEKFNNEEEAAYSDFLDFLETPEL